TIDQRRCRSRNLLRAGAPCGSCRRAGTRHGRALVVHLLVARRRLPGHRGFLAQHVRVEKAADERHQGEGGEGDAAARRDARSAASSITQASQAVTISGTTVTAIVAPPISTRPKCLFSICPTAALPPIATSTHGMTSIPISTDAPSTNVSCNHRRRTGNQSNASANTDPA